jgi:hypothetical protein
MFKFAILALVIFGSLGVYADDSNAPRPIGDPGHIAKYFQPKPKDSEPLTQDNSFFTIIAAFPTEKQADDFMLATLAEGNHPEVALQVFRPDPKNFSVMIAANTTSELSWEACQLAKDKKIGNIPPFQWTYPHKHKFC